VSVQIHLLEDELAGNQRNGDHPDDRRVANYEAEGGKKGADPVSGQCLIAELENIEQLHEIFFNRRRASSFEGSSGVTWAVK
jgi:hypothetical protein